jgi:hypothetical protein
VAKHVADRHQSVLDVVIHLSCEVTHGDPPLGLPQPGGADAESAHHRAEQTREGADLVGPVGGEVVVETVQVDSGGLLSETGEGPADAGG